MSPRPSAFPLEELPGLEPLGAWPPGPGAPPCLHRFQAGPVRIHALGLPSDPQPWIALLHPLASGERRIRAARFHFPMDALRCLGAEALLRQALGERPGLDLATLRLETGAHGKPRLASHPGVHFNLSHSGPWILCAVHDAPVGIDVEALGRETALPAHGVLSPEELRHYATLAPHPARCWFYRLWTLKESLLKAMGAGLTLDPRDITLRPEALDGPGVTAFQGDRPLTPWRLRELPMPQGVKAALSHGAEAPVPGCG